MEAEIVPELEDLQEQQGGQEAPLQLELELDQVMRVTPIIISGLDLLGLIIVLVNKPGTGPSGSAVGGVGPGGVAVGGTGGRGPALGAGGLPLGAGGMKPGKSQLFLWKLCPKPIQSYHHDAIFKMFLYVSRRLCCWWIWTFTHWRSAALISAISSKPKQMKQAVLTAWVFSPSGIRYPTGAGAGQGALKPGKGSANFQEYSPVDLNVSKFVHSF